MIASPFSFIDDGVFTAQLCPPLLFLYFLKGISPSSSTAVLYCLLDDGRRGEKMNIISLRLPYTMKQELSLCGVTALFLVHLPSQLLAGYHFETYIISDMLFLFSSHN